MLVSWLCCISFLMGVEVVCESRSVSRGYTAQRFCGKYCTRDLVMMLYLTVKNHVIPQLSLYYLFLYDLLLLPNLLA